MTASPVQSDELQNLLIALTDGELNGRQFAHLQDLLWRDPAAEAYYRHYMRLCALLEFEHAAADSGEAPETADEGDDDRRRPSAERASEGGEEMPVSPSSFPLPPSAVHYSLSTIHFPVGGILFSYVAAALILGVGLAIAGAWKLCGPRELSQSRPPIAERQREPEPKPALVGRITGMVDCKWEKEGLGVRGQGSETENPPSTIHHPTSHVALGDKLALASGLMEITYDTGAKVILQGPVTYEVESNGGYLAVGKLTGRLEKKNDECRMMNDELRTQLSDIHPSSFILHPFVVRTPTATITDLGTEFGVEVAATGTTETHVLRGAVELRIADASGREPRKIALTENRAVRVTADKSGVVKVSDTAVRPTRFVLRMPVLKRVPIKLFNTGLHVAEGQPDPHWQVALGSYDKKGARSAPQPAIVSSVTGDIESVWLPNDPGQSQWISTVGDAARVRGDVIYTFSTTFELAGVRPETARLGGWFYVDNHVRAIRLNGREMRVREHPYQNSTLIHSFTVRQGFVSGTNTLEFDVENSWGPDPYSQPNPMGLRVELEGSAGQESGEGFTPASVPPSNRGKEG